MFAVIRSGGKQYKVAPNDVIKVEKLAAEVGADVAFDEVLMLGDGDAVTVGRPRVEGARVSATVLEQIKDGKVVVFKKKRRKDYRRTRGHRQALTVLRVTEISAEPARKTKEKAAEGEAERQVEVEAEPQVEVEAERQADAGQKPAAKKSAAGKPAAKKAATKKPAAKKAAKAEAKAEDEKE